jgi:alcohol dehydrogenase class IV
MIMEDFIFRLPTRVMFGAGVIKKVGEVCRAQQATKIFLVTGQTSTKNSPFLPLIVDSLKQAGLSVQLYAEIEADPSIETVDRGVKVMKDFGADAVVAFGGGSPMDAAKSMAMLAANEGSIADYIRVRKTIAKRGLPVICIPTTAGTGSEVTAAAVTSDRQAKEKIGLSHDYMMPAVALVDPELHVSMPTSVTAATGIDALTHAIEAYVAVKATPVSDALALHAIRMIGANLRSAFANGSNMEARGNMAIASLIAGGAFANAGLGAVHGIAHPVGAQYSVAHGIANGIMLPYVMDYCLIANYPKFRDIAIALGEDISGRNEREAAQQAVNAVIRLNEDIGIPNSLLTVGVSSDGIEAIVKDAATYRLLPNSPRKLTAADLKIIVERAMK